MRDNRVNCTKITLWICVAISVISLYFITLCLDHAVTRQSDEIAKLMLENQRLSETVETLQHEVELTRTVLSDLHITDMNIQDKITDIDMTLSTIQKEHSKIVEADDSITLFSTDIAQEEPIPQEVKLPVFNPSDVTDTSNLTVSQLKVITPGTRFVGYEKELIELEKKYGINLIFAMSNSIQECGWLDENGYTAQHNYFGFKNRNPFKSLSDCLDYWFYWIKTSYVTERGLTTIGTIQPRYCPDDETWDDDIIRIGNKLINKLNITVE